MKAENDCMNCIFFVSFQQDYEDELEPNDQGFCREGKSDYFGNEGAGVGIVCKSHDKIKQI